MLWVNGTSRPRDLSTVAQLTFRAPTQCGTPVAHAEKREEQNETRLPESGSGGRSSRRDRRAGRPGRRVASAGAQTMPKSRRLPGRYRASPTPCLVAHEWNTYNGAIMSLVQEGLFSFDDNYAGDRPSPNPGSRWIPSPSKYKLCAGVTFQDCGSPLTADDVVHTMKWNMNPDLRSQLSAFSTPA